jgi:hypothetical protein
VPFGDSFSSQLREGWEVYPGTKSQGIPPPPLTWQRINLKEIIFYEAEISNNKPLTIVTIQVTNIDETLTKIIDNGGKIVETKREIPGVGLYATCSEPGGLLFGLIQS